MTPTTRYLHLALAWVRVYLCYNVNPFSVSWGLRDPARFQTVVFLRMRKVRVCPFRNPPSRVLRAAWAQGYVVFHTGFPDFLGNWGLWDPWWQNLSLFYPGIFFKFLLLPIISMSKRREMRSAVVVGVSRLGRQHFCWPLTVFFRIAEYQPGKFVCDLECSMKSNAWNLWKDKKTSYS